MNIHDFAESKGLSLRRVMDFTTGSNPLGPSNKAKHAIRKCIKNLDHYPDEKTRYLRRYICKKESIGDEYIVFGHGSTHLIGAILQVVKPKVACITSPFSYKTEDILNRYDVRIKPFPLNKESGFSLDIEKFLQSIEGADIVIISNPHNITGTVIPVEDIDYLIEAMDRINKIFIIDETYREFTKLVSPVRHVVRASNTLIVRTFSTFHALAGLHIGYMIGSTKLIQKIRNVLGLPQINSIAPYAALASLKDTGYKKRTLKFIEQEKGYILKKLSDIQGLKVFDTPCNFLLLEIERKENPNFKDLFLKHNILIDEYTGERDEHFIRLPIKRHKFNASFIKTLKKIMEAL
ncbi:MAG: histidinol-phosphate transaminase [Proteobacteria bacterium]|jgi:threonine-phosphate decarboxylase|nr:histidinol-phosphate transaminase [Pseudomonadota bacterium]